MQLVDMIGAAAVAVSTLSITPQLYKTWRIKHADDLSYGWLIAALAGAILWLLYGSMNGDWAIVLANVVGSTFVGTLLLMKRYYSLKQRALAGGPGT